jgi:processive 1,2-diacylglycerol beta-glucosyltransferase
VHLTKRILILSASVGSGHVRAAEAVELALQDIAPGLMFKNVDVLSLASSPFRRICGKGYLDVARRDPHLLGYVYDLLGRLSELKADRFRIALQRLNLKPFRSFWNQSAGMWWSTPIFCRRRSSVRCEARGKSM